MKFRGRMTDQLSIRKFYNILGTMARLSRVCVMRLAPDRVYFVLAETAASPTVWAELDRSHFFAEYNMEGVTAEDNEIYLEIEADRLARTLNALKSATASAARSLKVKLTRKRDTPCLSFEIELAPAGGGISFSHSAVAAAASPSNSSSAQSSRICTHDVPVSLIPRRLWADFAEPEMQAFDVSLYLPDLRQLKHLSERYKALGHYVVVEASRSGKLRLSVETDPVSVVTHFRDLETPRYDDTALSTVPGMAAGESRLQQRLNESVRNDEDGDDDRERFASVRVELKRFSLFLGAEQIAPKKVIANLVTGRMVHMFLVHDDVCIQYFIPAVME